MGRFVDLASPKGMLLGGNRARAREKEEEGKTVRDLTRIFVTVSGCKRCGLNWYLSTSHVSARVFTRGHSHGLWAHCSQIELIINRHSVSQVIGNVIRNNSCIIIWEETEKRLRRTV